MARVCHHCGREWTGEAKIGRAVLCDCGSALRCCLSCRFYDTKRHNDCGEPAAERVVEKNKANFCDYFEFVDRAEDADAPSGKKSAADKFNDLFKN